MNRLFYFIVFFAFLFVIQISAQQVFIRSNAVETVNYECGGFGNIVADVDFDNDGKTEIYLCNSNMDDRDCGELIPRLYKFEWNGTSWDSVWATVAPATIVELQNTWPALTWGDLDNDNKPELYWGPVNNFNTILNPARILVYEYPGDGSDNMGVSDGIGGFTPNAYTTIVNANSINLRPIKFQVADPDNDGTDELIFVDRQASSLANDFSIGIFSVDEIPDFGGGLETWTLEYSGVGDINLTATSNKWDMSIVDNYIYLWGEDGKVYPVRSNNGSWESLPGQSNIGYGSFKGSQVADIDNDGTKEIVVGSWFTSGAAKVFLVKQFGDTLQAFQIADLGLLGGKRLLGSASGDIDGDGNLDFVFGSRYVDNTVTNNLLFRVEYQGGDITDPANYVASVIDSLLLPQYGNLDVITIVNLDSDPEDEVIYTQGYPQSDPNNIVPPVVILNYDQSSSIERENDVVPDQFFVDQNYPNPFNPSTQIRFGIVEAANIDLRIYDALGREVAVLISNQFMGAGSYNVKFDASNLASGTYVYRMSTGANTVSKKMQLLK